jgi:hypothetical protein
VCVDLQEREVVKGGRGGAGGGARSVVGLGC